MTHVCTCCIDVSNVRIKCTKLASFDRASKARPGASKYLKNLFGTCELVEKGD